MAKTDTLQGSLDLLILKILSRRAPLHGYALMTGIIEISGDVLRVEEGSLYPALHRLEMRGLLRSEWGASDNNRRARFYALTARGRRHLRNETARWSRISAVLARFLTPADDLP